MKKGITLVARKIFRDYLQLFGLCLSICPFVSCNSCPIGELFPGSNICYWRRYMIETFENQITECGKMYSGGTLASIPNEDALNFIKAKFGSKFTGYGDFIAVKCLHSKYPVCESPEGEPVTYLPWKGGSRTSNGECVKVDNDGYNDQPCNAHDPAICSLLLSNVTTESVLTTTAITEATTETRTSEPLAIQSTQESYTTGSTPGNTQSKVIPLETTSISQTTIGQPSHLPGSNECLCICAINRNVSDSERVSLLSNNIPAFIQIMSSSVYGVGDLLTCQNTTSCTLPVDDASFRSCFIHVEG